ncbi:MAG: hypothetical protein GEU74_09045 [Nitriliruptorales bacterium]|nr:hypothetical protein [Nitriliruptorales bacterium]
MTDPTREPDTMGAADQAPPGMPRWVKVFVIIVGALLLVFVVLQLAGVGGRHGPRVHGANAQVVAPSYVRGPSGADDGI